MYHFEDHAGAGLPRAPGCAWEKAPVMGRGPLSSAQGTGSERQVGGAGAEGSGGEEICFLGCWMCERERQGGAELGK